MPSGEQRPIELDTAAVDALAAVLRIDPAEAAKIRDRTPSRRRPRPQDGPTADYR